MPFYRSVGEIPAKRHTLAGPADQPHAEELMGLNGFSSSSALLYHRRSPSALVSIESADDPRTTDRQCARPDHPLVPRHLRTGDLPAGTDLVTGRHVLLANRDVTVAVARADTTSPLYRTALGDELTFVQSGRARLETTFGSLDVGARRLRRGAHGDDASLGDRRGHRRDVRDRGPRRAHRSAAEVPRPVRTVPRRRAVLRARPARPDRAAARRRPRRRGPRAFGGRAQPPRPPRPSVRRGRLGRGALAVRLVDPRLRTDRRAHPSAPTGAPDVRGAGLRDLLVRAEVLRLPSAGREGAVPPRQRRQRRGALLLGGQLHEQGRLRHRRRIDLVPPGRLRARPAAGQSRALGGCRPDRGGGRDARHVPAARGDRRGALDQRRRTTPWSWSR